MTDEQILPAAGWYPDPESPSNVRYWDGAGWTQHSAVSQAPTWQAPALGRGFTSLATAIVVGLFVIVIVLVSRVALDVWGWSMIDNARAAGDGDSLNTFDNLDSALKIAFFLAIFITGILWMIWQSRLAKASQGARLRRSSAMHAWSWVIPVFSLWAPYQNIEDLWRIAVPDRDVDYLRVWWGSFLAFQIGTNLVDQLAANVNTVAGFKADMAFGIIASVIGIAAASMARHIVRALTAGRPAPQPAVDLRGFRAG